MSAVTVLSVFGTRPEAIKMAPVLAAMAQRPDRFTSIVCGTGQHREMLDDVLRSFDIRLHHDLRVMTADQRLAELTSKVLVGVGDVLADTRPHVLCVQGDTTTTLAAALAGFYARVPVAHVEAGLRTADLQSPFPEEANRLLTDRLAAFCFAPTELNRRNLVAEGIPPARIHVTGNTVVDAILLVADKVRSMTAAAWADRWPTAFAGVLDSGRPLILVTAHRRENFGAGLQAICEAVRALAHQHPDWHFVYPVHLNPSVQRAVGQRLAGVPNIHLVDPLPYEPFVYLMTRCRLILTDSGGVQEEACSLGTPVIVMREHTERQEAIDSGTVTLAGTDRGRIERLVARLMDAPPAAAPGPRANPYGDGRAAERIVDILWRGLRA